MKIELPRAIATRLWQMALEAPDNICGIIQKKQAHYYIEAIHLPQPINNEWVSALIPECEPSIWGYYQSFQQDISTPTFSCWQGLPQGCILIAIMLDIKGLLAFKAFHYGTNGVSTVDISLASE